MTKTVKPVNLMTLWKPQDKKGPYSKEHFHGAVQPGRPLHIHTMAGETWVAKDKASGSILSTITTTDAAEQRVELAVAPPAAKGRTPPSSRFGARRH